MTSLLFPDLALDLVCLECRGSRYFLTRQYRGREHQALI